MEKTRSRTKSKVESTTRKEIANESIPPVQETPVQEKKKGHILQISDEKGLPLIFIGDNFDSLSLESKIAVITHLKTFINNQKNNIIKMVEDL